MKTLHYIITIFLLAMIFFPSDVVLAQNETPPTIEFDEASYSTKNMHCDFYNTGKTSMPNQAHDNVIITLTDFNTNKFSASIDRVSVYVWSDSDTKGIEITAYETGVNSGIFKGKITISDGQSTQDVIHVNNGDTLSARYSSTPTGRFDTTNHDIIATSFIGISCPPFERVPASSIRILDTRGNENDVTTIDKQVLITSNIANPTGENQNFTYIVQIQDQNGSTASLAWLSGIMLPNQTSSPSISWTPGNVGNYVVSIFVWQSLTNPNALSAPLSADLTVLHDFANSKSSINDAKNLHCQLGFELMRKPTDGSPVCVTPDTATKLVERGWVKVLTTENITLNALENNCGQFYTVLHDNYHNGSETYPVLILKQNSIGCAKLTYTINYNYNDNRSGSVWSQMLNFTDMFHIGKYNYASHGNSFGVSSIDTMQMFKTKSIPEVVDLAKYPVGSQFTVILVIQPLPNATGFYDYSIEEIPCNSYPLAVGYSPDRVNSSDFSKGMVTMHNHSCFNGPYTISSVQVSGMDFKQIKFS